MTRDVIKTDETEEILQSLDLVAGRRAFIKALGVGAVGAAVFGAAAGTVTPAAAALAGGDIDILNFALNLEYLESAFYSYAASGKDIAASLTVGGGGQAPGTIAPGSKVPFTSPLVRAYAVEIANEELRHVEVLRAVLAANAVARPTIDVAGAFQKAATAAGIAGTFSPYTSDANFLIGSYIFEDVGVTAYHGAASLIQDPDILNYAAGILAVEAYHAGIIRTSLFAQQSATIRGLTDKISALRSILSTGKELVDDIGIGSTGAIGGPDAPTIVPVDAPNATMFIEVPGGDAIAYSRNTTQVLNIVYGSPTTTPGVFFPNGMNFSNNAK